MTKSLFRYSILLFALVLARPLSGEAQVDIVWSDILAESPLVHVDDTIIRARDLETYLENSGTIPTGHRDADLRALEERLEMVIDRACIILDLDSNAILADPDTRRHLRRRMATAAQTIAFRRYMAPQVHISDETIERIYQDSLETVFTTPKRREVRHLLVAPKWTEEGGKRKGTRADVEQAREKALAFRAAVEAGAAFDSLAGAISDDLESRARNGYLGWVFPGNTDYDFDTAAFAAAIGEIRGPVKTIYGYHLIRVEAERPESTIALNDSLTALIRAQLAGVEAKRIARAWSDSAFKETEWRFNEAVLTDTLNVPDDTTWLLLVNERDTVRYGTWKHPWEYHKMTHGIEGHGTVDEKKASLKTSGFPYIWAQLAEDRGFDREPAITDQRRDIIRSKALGLANSRLYELQATVEVPAIDTMVTEPEPIPKPLNLQMIRARDSASIWAAYRRLVAGDSMETVVRWYHDNIRDIRSGRWNLGWVGKGDLPGGLFGKAWILGAGKFTRPEKVESSYYILRLLDRRTSGSGPDELHRLQTRRIADARARGLEIWRKQVRAGHRIRLDLATWRRVKQLWRR